MIRVLFTPPVRIVLPQLELGVTKFTLMYDQDTWSGLATNSWIKSLWEKVDKLGIDINLMYEPISIPRNKDTCIIEMFVKLGIQGEQLKQINKCRKRQ